MPSYLVILISFSCLFFKYTLHTWLYSSFFFFFISLSVFCLVFLLLSLHHNGLETLGAGHIHGLDIWKQLLLGTFLVVSLAGDTDSQSVRSALDAALPELLVEEGVETHIRGAELLASKVLDGLDGLGGTLLELDTKDLEFGVSSKVKCDSIRRQVEMNKKKKHNTITMKRPRRKGRSTNSSFKLNESVKWTLLLLSTLNRYGRFSFVLKFDGGWIIKYIHACAGGWCIRGWQRQRWRFSAS